jgi:hypothetical protein
MWIGAGPPVFIDASQLLDGFYGVGGLVWYAVRKIYIYGRVNNPIASDMKNGN